MLVLSRKIGEKITIGNSIEISILSFDRGIVRLGISAPKSVPVHRKEVFDKIIELNKQAAKTEIQNIREAISKARYNFNNTINREENLQVLKFSSGEIKSN
jgi:carbon storage regulator